MANQLKMAIVQAILSLHAQGWSQRAIAKRLQVHRETVSRHVRRAAGGSKPATLPAGPGTDEASPPPPSEDDRSKPATLHAGNQPRAESPRYCGLVASVVSPVGEPPGAGDVVERQAVVIRSSPEKA